MAHELAEQRMYNFPQASICTANGDSGGPLYGPVTSQAIGILSDGAAAIDGESGEENCDPAERLFSKYTSANVALESASEKKDGRVTFKLITT